MYIHELKNWPKFLWDQEKIASPLIQVRHQQGRLIGGMESIGFQLREEVVLQTLTQDVIKSSEIEGEILDQSLVRSSVARHLGMEDAALGAADRNVDGIVEMMLDATQKFDQPLTKERLFNWHAALFPTGRSGFSKVKVATWRTGPVQVVSGHLGKEKVHFDAPPALRVDSEMELFLNWFNQKSSLDLVLKAALAHFWFVTIHPFDDRNGRIARAIADMVLARSEKSSHRFYSLTAQIQMERTGYYTILEQTQKGSLDITPWIEWFLCCLARAIEKALSTLEVVTHKARIWESLTELSLNERQRKLINRLLDGFIGNLCREGLKNRFDDKKAAQIFCPGASGIAKSQDASEGKIFAAKPMQSATNFSAASGITSSKWAKIAKCSQDTAYRDILDLIDRGILIKNREGGRSTSYSLSPKIQ